MVDGWPGRVARNNYGPTMEDERQQVDPTNEIDADQVNLSFWQDAGIGLCAPKVVLRYFAGEGVLLRYGLIAWDQVLYDNAAADAPPSILSFTINGTGDYNILFDNEALGRPDENGDQQLEPLAFQFGWVGANLAIPGARAIGEFELVSPQEFRIRTYALGAPAGGPFVVVGW